MRNEDEGAWAAATWLPRRLDAGYLAMREDSEAAPSNLSGGPLDKDLVVEGDAGGPPMAWGLAGGVHQERGRMRGRAPRAERGRAGRFRVA